MKITGVHRRLCSKGCVQVLGERDIRLVNGAPVLGVGSKIIVAINKDPDAHIFEEIDFGVVGDYRDASPAL